MHLFEFSLLFHGMSSSENSKTGLLRIYSRTQTISCDPIMSTLTLQFNHLIYLKNVCHLIFSLFLWKTILMFLNF